MTSSELKDCLVVTDSKVPKKPEVMYEIPYHSVVPQSHGVGQKGREVTSEADLKRIAKQQKIEEIKQ